MSNLIEKEKLPLSFSVHPFTPLDEGIEDLDPTEPLVDEDSPRTSNSPLELFRTQEITKKAPINNPEQFRMFFIILITTCMELKEKQSQIEMDDISKMQEIKEALFLKLQESNIAIQNNFLVSFFGSVETVMTQISIVLGFGTLFLGYQFAVLSLISSFLGACGNAAHLFFKSKEDLLRSQMVMQQSYHKLIGNRIENNNEMIALHIEDWIELAHKISDQINDLNLLTRTIIRNTN